MQLPLFVAGIAFVAGAGVMAGAVDIGMLVAGRVLLGIGVGLASLVVPMCECPSFQAACMTCSWLSALRALPPRL